MTQSIKDILRRFGHSVYFSEIPSEIRQEIHRLCANFVGGAWARVQAEEIGIKHLRGGTSNILFLCHLPVLTNDMLERPVPQEMLLRVYFNPNTENHVLEESVVFTLLSERLLGPKLYGVFREGRLEEYIHSRPLSTEEIRLPMVSARIARILAQIHQLTMPIEKTPTYLADSMRKWMSQLRSLYSKKKLEKVTVGRINGVEKKFTLDELENEVDLVITCIEKSQSPIVFCHNDFQEGNILLKNGGGDFETTKLSVIDFEYASYNYRAFDIANHFCEWTLDYHSNNSHPYFHSKLEFYPNEDQQTIFAKHYLSGLIPQHENTVTNENIRAFLDEVKSFVPVSHFFWGVWSLLLAETSPVKFGFTEYAHSRLERYFALRHDLLKLLINGQPYTNGVHDDRE